ncbi:MAG: M43 family zinc metalloprotease [Bacteroidota bacterium]
MKLNLSLIAAALCISFCLNAQNSKSSRTVPASALPTKTPKRSCGTIVPSAEWDNWFNQKVEDYKTSLATGKTQAVNYTIPVIVHVIHGGQAVGTFPNLAQGQINSQIAVLNADFNGTGFNVGNLPTAFAAAKANTGVSFCLAQKDPNGVTLAEPGIERISYIAKGWANPAAAAYNTPTTFQNYVNGTIKPGSIWDPTRYMNIWITDENAATGLLGYAAFPAGTGLVGLSGFGTATTDGLWCWSKSFGSNTIFPGGTYDPIYNKGRTATHEIGHWVGLRHIWGDGTCLTDYCNDTPSASTSNFGCPTFPSNVGVCAGNTTGEMTMNFMDYTDDPCMYMFTNDQTIRIQTAMANGTFRSQLSASSASLCGIAPIASFTVAANECVSKEINPANQTTGSSIISYTWTTIPSTSVSIAGGSTSTPTLVFGTPGTYTVNVAVSNGFGTSSKSNVMQIGACVGIKENSALNKNICLIPNPSNGIINIVTTLANSQTLEISVHNALGQMISSNKYAGVTSNSFALDLTSYLNGVYFVTVNNGEEKIVKRLILNK